MTQAISPENLLNQVEAVYQQLEAQAVEAPGNRELSAGVIVILSALVAQQDTVNSLVSELVGVKLANEKLTARVLELESSVSELQQSADSEG